MPTRTVPGPARPTDLESLRDAAASGLRAEYVFFLDYGGVDRGQVDRSCLSQWWPSPFEIDGTPFRTAEQRMMHLKAKLFGDEAAAQAILASRTPYQAQLLGRQVEGYDEALWSQHRFGIVVEANLAKFRANPAMGDFLRSTGDAVLVEASPTDLVWGAGVSGEDPFARDPRRWSGLNLLGFALMVVRDRLREG
jgi:ribA/ribD-fused uncharacterized protein